MSLTAHETHGMRHDKAPQGSDTKRGLRPSSPSRYRRDAPTALPPIGTSTKLSTSAS